MSELREALEESLSMCLDDEPVRLVSAPLRPGRVRVEVEKGPGAA